MLETWERAWELLIRSLGKFSIWMFSIFMMEEFDGLVDLVLWS